MREFGAIPGDARGVVAVSGSTVLIARIVVPWEARSVTIEAQLAFFAEGPAGLGIVDLACGPLLGNGFESDTTAQWSPVVEGL